MKASGALSVRRVVVSTQVYPIEAVLNACYARTDDFYFFLDMKGKRGGLEVVLKPKARRTSPEALDRKIDAWKDELVFFSLRHRLARQNRKLREYIVGSALYSRAAGNTPEIPRKTRTSDGDPLGIAVPWQEKYGQKKK